MKVFIVHFVLRCLHNLESTKQKGSPCTPGAHISGPPFALGSMFPERRGWYAEKLYVTLRYQIYSVNQYLKVRGIFPWSLCVRRGCLLSMHHVFVIVFLNMVLIRVHYMYILCHIFVRLINRVSPTNGADSHNWADPTNGPENLTSSHNCFDFPDVAQAAVGRVCLCVSLQQ